MAQRPANAQRLLNFMVMRLDAEEDESSGVLTSADARPTPLCKRRWSGNVTNKRNPLEIPWSWRSSSNHMNPAAARLRRTWTTLGSTPQHTPLRVLKVHYFAMTEGFCFHNDDQPVRLVPVTVRAHQECVKPDFQGSFCVRSFLFFFKCSLLRWPY